MTRNPQSEAPTGGNKFMQTTSKSIFPTLSFVTLLIGLTAQAQINLPALSYSQNFDSLGSASATWTDNSTLTGWYAAVNVTNTSVISYTTAYTASTGGGTSSSTLYALGASLSTERALGGAPSSSNWGMLGMRLVNTSGGLFDNLVIRFDMEQWSDRGTANVGLSYQIFAPGGGSLSTLSGWSELGVISSPLPVNGTPVSAIGNTTGLVANNSFAINSLGWQNGDELWFKWTITKVAGNNSAHGIDNVVVAVPEPSVLALVGLGLLLLARPFCRNH